MAESKKTKSGNGNTTAQALGFVANRKATEDEWQAADESPNYTFYRPILESLALACEEDVVSSKDAKTGEEKLLRVVYPMFRTLEEVRSFFPLAEFCENGKENAEILLSLSRRSRDDIKNEARSALTDKPAGTKRRDVSTLFAALKDKPDLAAEFAALLEKHKIAMGGDAPSGK